RIFDARATAGGTKVPYFAGNSTSGSVPATLVDPAELEGCSMPVMASMVHQDKEPEFLTPLLDAYKGSKAIAPE
ncbi:hypothetical protein ACC691_41205, partial [Rhizobium johnstonii]|uniref:hypothetical protein n=1 Tax=Rhizobium johnstonii TaxID=3019933 RepID=UPI003F9867F9